MTVDTSPRSTSPPLINAFLAWLSTCWWYTTSWLCNTTGLAIQLVLEQLVEQTEHMRQNQSDVKQRRSQRRKKTIKLGMMEQGTQSMQIHDGREMSHQQEEQQQAIIADSRKHLLDESAWEQEQESVTSSDDDQHQQQSTKQQEEGLVKDEEEYDSENDDGSVSDKQPNDDNDELLAWMDLYTEELIWNTRYNRMMISMSFAFANKEGAQPIIVERKIRRVDSIKMSQMKHMEQKKEDANARKKSKLSDSEARSAKWKTLRMANIPAFGMGLAKAAAAATSSQQPNQQANVPLLTPTANACVTNQYTSTQPLTTEHSVEKPKPPVLAPSTSSASVAEHPKFRFFPAKPSSSTVGIASTLSSVASGLSSMSTSPPKQHAISQVEPVALSKQQPQILPPAKPLAYKSYMSSSSMSSISSVESETKKRVQFAESVAAN